MPTTINGAYDERLSPTARPQWRRQFGSRGPKGCSRYSERSLPPSDSALHILLVRQDDLTMPPNEGPKL